MFEDRKVKAEAIAKAQAVVPDAIFGSNTSTLPITSLAESSKDPAKFIGIHFFSPVERMMLVEIILGKKTGDAALALALDYVRAIRKTPIVVNDFARLLHLARGRHLSARRPPDAGRRHAGGDDRECRPHGRHAGRPAVAQRRGRGRSGLEDPQGDRGRSRRGGDRSAAEGAARGDGREARRLGRKNGKGFYDYPEKGPKRLWPGLAELQPTKLDPDTIDVQELKQRLLGIQALETARCFEEGVITDVREADVGSILGFGFAPFSGGTLSYIDMMGAQAFVELCRRLEKKYGPRFAPSKLLLDMAEKGESFYGRFAPGKKAA